MKKQKTRVSLLSMTLVLTLAVPLLTALFSSSAPTAEAWMSSDWTYRRPIAITNENTTAAIENFQENIFLNVNGWAHKPKADFSDLRFAAENNEPIPYWIENYTADNATVWIRYPWSIAASSSATIYVYYGNAGASSAENGDNTFPFFDTFPGAALDTTKWYKSGDGSVTVVNSEMTMTVSATNDPMVDSKENFGYNTAMRTRQKYNKYTMMGLSDREGVTQRNITGDGITAYETPGGTLCYTVNNGNFTSLGVANNPLQNTYYIHEFRRASDDSIVKYYLNDVLNGTSTTNIPDANIHAYFTPYAIDGGGSTTVVDWVLVRKYVPLEPIANVGAEEAIFKPEKPTSPYCENQTNPTQLLTFAPHFNAVFTDNDSGDNALYVQVQVGTSTGDNSLWDSDWMSATDQSGGKLENNERCTDITYAGTTLSRGVTYHWRVRFKDNYGLTSDWSDDQTFKIATVEITQITVDSALVDRKVDVPGSGADNDVRIYVTVVDFGRDRIENCYLWIRDNTDSVVAGFDNFQLIAYDNIDSNTKRFWIDFDPDNSSQVGYFDVKAQAVDNGGLVRLENTKDYTAAGFGYQLFKVDDLTVSAALDTANPIHQTGVSGNISRVTGDAASADNVRVVDNNEGTLAPDSFGNTSYSDNYGLVSPTCLRRGDKGSIYVWARDDTLDGKSSSQSYMVQGDNATVTLGNINNQVGQSVVNFTVKWSDSANVTSGTAYHQDNASYSVAITNGSGSFTLSHSIWKLMGATIITMYDNADRPLWNVSNATFNTDKLAWAENQPLSGTNDNASFTIKVTYNDGSTNNTIKAELLVGTVDNLKAHDGQVTTDTNGLMAWSGIDLPDDSSNIQIRLDNVFDSITNKVINARNVEDAVVYASPSVASLTINGGASSTTSSTVTLTLSASSVGSNVYQMCFSNDNASWSAWEGYSTSKSWELSSGDGLKTVYVKVCDLVLNESTVLSASITKTTSSEGPPSGGTTPGGGYTPPDTTPPTLTVLEPTSLIVGENVTVIVSASDSSGIDSGSISVKLDGGTVQHSWTNSVITSTFVKLSIGSHLVVARVNDASTNHNQTSINISFTVVPSTVENIEAIENATPAHTEMIAITIGTLGAKENGTAVFDNENFSITSVAVTIGENLGESGVVENVAISAQVLENAPAEASPPENVTTYAYLEISTTAPENALASVTINFKVSKAWLQASGMSSLAVALYHLENGAWVELATTEVGEDNFYVYYSAVTTSLSPFMIGAQILFPTFNLQLPATPLEVENGYAQVRIWITNPTANTLVKHCELRFDNNVEFFDIVVDPYENVLVTVYVRVEGVAPGIHDVKLYDTDTNTVLDVGQVTLLGITERPETPPVIAAPPSALPSIAMIGTAIGMVVGIGVLYITGRIPKIKMPSVKLPSVKKPRPTPSTPTLKRSLRVREPEEEESLIVQTYHNIIKPAACEFLEEDSPVVQGYCGLLSPAAHEVAAKEVKHLGRAMKPYKKKHARREFVRKH